LVDHSARLIRSVTEEDARGKALSFACAAYLVGYAGYCFQDSVGSLRYFTYTAPLILFVTLALQREPIGNSAAIVFLLIYSTTSGVRYVAEARGDNLFLANTIVITLSVMACAAASNVGMRHIRAVFLCSLVYFAVAYWLAAPGEIRLYRIFQNQTGSGVESGFDNNEGGLLGPIYAVFFYGVSAKALFALALVESILGGKRIGIVAIIVGIISLSIFQRIPTLRNWRNRFLILLCALTFVNVLGCNLSVLSEQLYGATDTRVSLEEVMLGRHAIGVAMTNVLANRPLTTSLLGAGAGSADALALLVTDGTLAEPHNDWLKIVFDYGIIGSVVMTVFFAAVFSASKVGAAIAVANAVVMTTDNVLIYIYYQFPIALMAAWSASRELRTVERT
jgi:hypothetical protein